MDFITSLFRKSSVAQLDAAQVQERIKQSPKPYLLDVRTAGEYKRGHISGSVLIPLNELAEKLSQIPKEREVICICESGSRSRVASHRLEKQGYRVSNLRGGLNSWTRAGLPVKNGSSK